MYDDKHHHAPRDIYSALGSDACIWMNLNVMIVHIIILFKSMYIIDASINVTIEHCYIG